MAAGLAVTLIAAGLPALVGLGASNPEPSAPANSGPVAPSSEPTEPRVDATDRSCILNEIDWSLPFNEISRYADETPMNCSEEEYRQAVLALAKHHLPPIFTQRQLTSQSTDAELNVQIEVGSFLPGRGEAHLYTAASGGESAAIIAGFYNATQDDGGHMIGVGVETGSTDRKVGLQGLYGDEQIQGAISPHFPDCPNDNSPVDPSWSHSRLNMGDVGG